MSHWGAALSPCSQHLTKLFGYGDQSNRSQAGSCFGQLCYAERVLPDGGLEGATSSSVITTVVPKITQELDKSFCSV